MRLSTELSAELHAGLQAIRTENDVPVGFPAEAEAEAERSARRPLGPEHRDLTAVEFVTLDPLGSTDLDQAFALGRDGDDLVLQYAIADVAWFVEPGGALETEAWRRGVTVYLPDGKASLYPAAIGEHAGSLLPDGPRPATVLRVRLAPDGTQRLDDVQRAVIASRAKLAYETVRDTDLSPLLVEFAARVTAAEERRGASRVEFPEQEVTGDPDTPGSFKLVLRERRASEDENATLSLAANLAVASAFLGAQTGLFRTMPEPTPHDLSVLRHVATFLGIDWPTGMALGELERTLEPGPRTAAFLLGVRRAGGGAGYEPYSAAHKPWHAAIAATYAHATAPLRRLADRYVLEAALAVAAGDPVPQRVLDAFTKLPEVMDRAEARAGKVDRAVVDLMEAVSLAGLEGQTFSATVIDADEKGARIQLAEPPVVARMATDGLAPGDLLDVRLVTADPGARKVEFSRR